MFKVIWPWLILATAAMATTVWVFGLGSVPGFAAESTLEKWFVAATHMMVWFAALSAFVAVTIFDRRGILEKVATSWSYSAFVCVAMLCITYVVVNSFGPTL